MSKFVKNSHIWGRIYFIFLQHVLKQTFLIPNYNFLIPNFDLSEKIGKAVTK